MDPVTAIATKAVIPPTVQGFVNRVFGAPMGEAGELIADQIRSWRFKNQVTILGRAEKLLRDAGREPRAVNLKLLVPLLENAGLEDDAEAQSLWAHLLANATQDQRNTVFHRTYVDLLKNLSGIEAHLLGKMFLEWKEAEAHIVAAAMQNGAVDGVICPDDAVKFYISQIFSSVPSSDAVVILDNLFRMNLVRYPESKEFPPFGGIFDSKPLEIYLTHLGIRLLSICTTLEMPAGHGASSSG